MSNVDFPVRYCNERDVEILLLLNFVDAHSTDIESALDIGCCGSVYALRISQLVPVYDGIDFAIDQAIVPLLDHYFQGDVLTVALEPYDLVSAVSVIEHYGVKQEPSIDFRSKQQELVARAGRLAKKYIFLSFPYGLPGMHENEFANIDEEQLKRFERILEDFRLTETFYFNDNPTLGSHWAEIVQAVASGIEYVRTLGTRCVCILEGRMRGL